MLKKALLSQAKLKLKKTSIVTILESEDDSLAIDDLDEDIDVTSLDDDSIANKPVQILVRPVQQFDIQPKSVSIEFESTDEAISIVPVTQLQIQRRCKSKKPRRCNIDKNKSCSSNARVI